MKNRKPYIHRGKILAAAVQATGLNKDVVAKKAGYKQRSSYYKHIDKPDLGYHILIRYGRAIDHDFRPDIPGMPKYIFEDQPEGYSKSLTADEIARQEDLKDKYIKKSDEYDKLMEQHMNLMKQHTKLKEQYNNLKQRLKSR